MERIIPFVFAFALIAISQVTSHINLFTVCDTKSLNGHSLIATGNTVDVALVRKEDGTKQTCFEPSEKYYGKMLLFVYNYTSYFVSLL